jgi:CheY-like chemotaxis protein
MKKVYVIDDDRDIVESITMILESGGYEVASQMDEKNAIGNITEFGPDVIILDVMLPGNDEAGFQIARDIRQAEAIKTKPILMLSAVNEQGPFPGTFSNNDRDESWMPVDQFVDKPVEPTTLLEKVKTLAG